MRAIGLYLEAGQSSLWVQNQWQILIMYCHIRVGYTTEEQEE